jgi:hypothetical protein
MGVEQDNVRAIEPRDHILVLLLKQCRPNQAILGSIGIRRPILKMGDAPALDVGLHLVTDRDVSGHPRNHSNMSA